MKNDETNEMVKDEEQKEEEKQPPDEEEKVAQPIPEQTKDQDLEIAVAENV